MIDRSLKILEAGGKMINFDEKTLSVELKKSSPKLTEELLLRHKANVEQGISPFPNLEFDDYQEYVALYEKDSHAILNQGERERFITLQRRLAGRE